MLGKSRGQYKKYACAWTLQSVAWGGGGGRDGVTRRHGQNACRGDSSLVQIKRTHETR